MWSTFQRIKQGHTFVVLRPETLLKRDSTARGFQQILRNFEEKHFYRISLVAVSETNMKQIFYSN